jgi:hypothetical protein
MQVPAGAGFDQEAALFVHDAANHAAYARGVATERADRADLLCAVVVESSEELRLLVCALTGGLAWGLAKRGAAAVLRPYFDDTILLLESQVCTTSIMKTVSVILIVVVILVLTAL